MSSPGYPLVPPAWWCGEFKAEYEWRKPDSPAPFAPRIYQRVLPKVNIGSSDPIDACCCCVYWLAQSTGEGFCRRYPPSSRERVG